MAEEYFMFDSVNHDRLVTAADFAKYYNELLTNGVFYRNGNPSLAVTKGTGMQSVVSVGASFVEGYLYRNTTAKTITHAASNATNPRIDRIVVRLDRNIAVRNITVTVKQGTPATNPVPPALTRNDLVYELSLAQVLIPRGATAPTTITDERFVESLCGIVNGVTELPTDVYQAQWDAFIGSIQQGAPALGGMTISVQNTTPANPKNKDIWFDTR